MNIALLGFGVVGSGVYEWCLGREDLHVRRVLVRSEKPQIADIATHDLRISSTTRASTSWRR